MHLVLVLHIMLSFSIYTAKPNEDIFKDYCQPGLCKYFGGDGKHSGCKDGVLHNGELQRPSCPENAAIIPLTDSDKELILDFHNKQRNFVACGGLFKDYGLEPGCRHGVVTWDKELEATAFLHTSYCIYEHDKCRSTAKYILSGQNLGQISYDIKPEKSPYYINIIHYLWYVEYYYTKVDMINAFYPQNKWKVGHFLTSLNERNNRVGCTFSQFFYNKTKKNIVMLSCNYPTTNLQRGTVYNSCKVPASKCSTGTDPKYKFLCSADEKYDVSDLLDHIPYDGDGTEVFDNCGRPPEFFHYEREGGDGARIMHRKLYPDWPMLDEKSDKQTTRKPMKLTTKKPTSTAGTPGKSGIKKPKLDSPEGNPNAGGIPDYSEDEYDPPDSSSAKLWHQYGAKSSYHRFLDFVPFLVNCLFLCFPHAIF